MFLSIFLSLSLALTTSIPIYLSICLSVCCWVFIRIRFPYTIVHIHCNTRIIPHTQKTHIMSGHSFFMHLIRKKKKRNRGHTQILCRKNWHHFLCVDDIITIEHLFYFPMLGTNDDSIQAIAIHSWFNNNLTILSPSKCPYILSHSMCI